MKLLVPLRSPNRFYLMKWRGQHCLDMCKTYSLLRSTDLMAAQNHWPPKDWWLENLGILHQHGPKSSQKKCRSTFCAISKSKCMASSPPSLTSTFLRHFCFHKPNVPSPLHAPGDMSGNPDGQGKTWSDSSERWWNSWKAWGFFFSNLLTRQTPEFRSGMVRRKNSTP